MDKVNIELVSNSPRIKMELKKGVETKVKYTSLDMLFAFIAKNVDFNTGILPRGTRCFSGTSAKYKILIETAPMKKIVNLYSGARASNEEEYKGHSEELVFPHLLFYFSVEQNVFSDSKIFALKNTLRDLNDPVFIFPYGNVYSDGNVCWGSAKNDTSIKSPMNLIFIIASFLDSKYNGDLAERTMNSSNLSDFTSPYSFWSFVEYMKEKQSFPTEALIQANCLLSSLF